MFSIDENDVIKKLQNLDSQTIGAIYDRYYLEVYRYALYRLADEQVAEDLASDVFVRLLEAVDKNRGPQNNLKGWLIGTASHLITDELRKKYRRPTEAISDSFPDLRPGTASEVDAREQKYILQGALAKLTDEQQQVLSLRFGQEYSLEETAVILKKNVNAVKALQFRALAALQRVIGKVSDES